MNFDGLKEFDGWSDARVLEDRANWLYFEAKLRGLEIPEDL